MRKSHTKSVLAVILGVSLVAAITTIGFAQGGPVAGYQYNLADYEALTGKTISEFSEAPELRVQVAAGELPAVAKRLPEDLVVVEPVEEIGQYGGLWRRYAPRSDGWLYAFGLEPLIRYAGMVTASSDFRPNIVKGWDISDDGTSITLFLRKGMKWSDGEPFTADDIVWQFEDVYGNDELYAVKPGMFVAQGGVFAKAEKLDEYTARLTFGEPMGMLLDNLAENAITYSPKHYLKQFLPKYADAEKLDSMVKEAGLEHWYELFTLKKDYRINGDCPVVYAFKPTEDWRLGLNIAKRNPYYWKVDPAGNQLPYIDEVSLMYTPENMFLPVMTGQSEFQGSYSQVIDYPLYMENREKGDYRVIMAPRPLGSGAALQLNQNVQDPVLRKIYNDIRFRQALSLAVNREEINDVVFLGLSPIVQATVSPTSSLYEEEFGQVSVEFDLDRANELLDEIGLEWDAKHEWRLRSDGERLQILNIMRSEPGDPYLDVAAMMKPQFAKIGVDIINSNMKDTLWGARVSNNEHEAAVNHAITGPPFIGFLSTFENRFVGWSVWGVEWGNWIGSDGENGIEPPEHIKRLHRLADQFMTTVDPDERTEVGKEYYRIHAENLYIIGLGGVDMPSIYIAKNYMRNIPEEGLVAGGAGAANFHPEQFFIRQD